MCVCVHVCEFVCMHVCLRACMCVCVLFVYLCACKCVLFVYLCAVCVCLGLGQLLAIKLPTLSLHVSLEVTSSPSPQTVHTPQGRGGQ